MNRNNDVLLFNKVALCRCIFSGNDANCCSRKVIMMMIIVIMLTVFVDMARLLLML